MHHASCIMHDASWIIYHASCLIYHASCIMYYASCTRGNTRLIDLPQYVQPYNRALHHLSNSCSMGCTGLFPLVLFICTTLLRERFKICRYQTLDFLHWTLDFRLETADSRLWWKITYTMIDFIISMEVKVNSLPSWVWSPVRNWESGEWSLIQKST